MKINDCGQGGPFFAAVDHAGQPLLFRTDSDQRLHLMRFCAERGWRRVCLSAALPAGGTLRVACADVRQMGDGRIVAAISTLDREGRSRLHVVCGLSCGLDDEGWTAAMRNAQEAVLPDGVQVSRLDFGPLQAGAPPLLLVTGMADGEECHWHLNAAAAFVPARALRLPDGMAGATGYAVGCFRLPGLWALCPEGCEGLRFCSFPDAFGWKVEVQYAGLPADAASFRLAAGVVPNVPDLFAAGDRIVVYRGGNGVPQLVSQTPDARLLWAAQDNCAEHLAYADAEEALWMVSRPLRGAWGRPRMLTRERAVLASAPQGGVNAFSVGGEWMQFGIDGQPLAAQAASVPL
jgi:hypothetical protein